MERNDKNKVNLTKLQFTGDVWEQVDSHQQEELQLAICGLSEEYELADVVAHLAVSVEWTKINEQITVLNSTSYLLKMLQQERLSQSPIYLTICNQSSRIFLKWWPHELFKIFEKSVRTMEKLWGPC